MNAVGSSRTSQSLPPSSKRPHLDPGETGLWPYTSKNKPVGIAQPFQKKENMEVESMDNLQKREDMLKLEQEGDLKAGLELDFKAKPDLKSRDMTTKDVFGSNVERASTAGKKLSGKRHSSADSDSDSDSSSSFSYPFEPPSESSDDAVPAGEDRGEHGIISTGSTSGEGGGRKDETVDSRISGRGKEVLVTSVLMLLHVLQT